MTKEEAITFLKCDRERTCYDFKIGHCDGCNTRTALDMAIKALKAEPVKHGHWTDNGHKGRRRWCSECGGIAFEEYDDYGLAEVTETDYCPHCGAKMDEVTDGYNAGL